MKPIAESLDAIRGSIHEANKALIDPRMASRLSAIGFMQYVLQASICAREVRQHATALHLARRTAVIGSTLALCHFLRGRYANNSVTPPKAGCRPWCTRVPAVWAQPRGRGPDLVSIGSRYAKPA